MHKVNTRGPTASIFQGRLADRKDRYEQFKTTDKHEPREIRRKLGLNQQQFWSKIGVTQSGGSRYESGPQHAAPGS